MVLNNKNSTF
uniref:Uncharacterized protein n=1 Tax=Anguilla anguilla TaxID=7936 RepID=A0A0E9X9W0_ANGAN